MSAPQQSRFYTSCADCNHVWIAAYLYMEVRKLARLMRGLHCPACGAGRKRIFMATKEQVARLEARR